MGLRCRGGAKLNFAEKQVLRAIGYDILAIVVDSNSLNSGPTFITNMVMGLVIIHLYGLEGTLTSMKGIASTPDTNHVTNCNASQQICRTLFHFWGRDGCHFYKTVKGVHLERTA